MNYITQADPFQGLSTYLRCEARGIPPEHPSVKVLRDWADEVDRAALAQPANEWKEAVINELVVAHILTAEHETNPRKAVQDAISWNCQVALDPAVSADAQALIDRGMAQPAEPVEPTKTRVEECRGYALLGTGQYCINHTPDFHPELGAELVITLATDEDKSGNRQVGESRDNPEPGKPIQPEEIVIRIGFLSERGLFALEDQLAWIRRLHFSEAAAKERT